MTITEVRIKLCEENHERLLAFCSITLDHAFVIRDLKIIEGGRGLFVAMPSRKLTDRCPGCGGKNHLRANYCNQCGRRLDSMRATMLTRTPDTRAKLHADIAHPIHAGSREMMQAAVVRAYWDEKEKSKLPGYICRYDDYDAEFDDPEVHVPGSLTGPAASPAPSRTRTDAPHPVKGPHFSNATPRDAAPPAHRAG